MSSTNYKIKTMAENYIQNNKSSNNVGLLKRHQNQSIFQPNRDEIIGSALLQKQSGYPNMPSILSNASANVQTQQISHFNGDQKIY